MPQCQPTTVATRLKIQNAAPRSRNIAVARGARRQKSQANLPEPKLKGLIDRVLVPNLVKAFMEKEKLRNEESDDRGSKS